MKYGIVVLGIASLLSASALAESPPTPGPHSGDRLFLATDEGQFRGPLPIGPLTGTGSSGERFDGMAFDADGRLLAVAPPGPPPSDPPVSALHEIDADGQTLFVGDFELLTNEYPVDLAFDSHGRLYLLTSRLVYWNPPDVVSRLVELDPDSGAVLAAVELGGDFRALAPAPDGLWVLSSARLHHLDPSTAVLTDAGPSVPSPLGTGIRAADVDSTGALWVLVAYGQDQTVWRIDPETGARGDVPLEFPNANALAVRRQCQSTATARCLHGGRFRAQVLWRDFANRSGEAKAARSHTADSALFWFFDASNWELMVKVLNGCENNGHFWVFAAATTNVGYTLWVTDLETDETWLYDNPLGARSAAVTDTTAFAICP